jgi:cytidine deaminase
MDDDEALIEAAAQARSHAHAPYSGFAVGAALRDRSGRVHAGANVENASLGLSICAERAAVCRAVAEGARSFDAIAIVTASEVLTPPCGACRQFLVEFAPELRVLLADLRGARAEYRLAELLAHPFRDYRPARSGG